MNTIILFTDNSSIRNHWEEVLPKKYTPISIEHSDTLIEYLKKDENTYVMVDENSMENAKESFKELQKFSQTTLLVFNNELNLQHATSMLKYGIRSYENSYLNKISLRNLIDSVKNGNTWLYPALTAHLISSYVAVQRTDEIVRVERRSTDRFTKKEKEVLSYITKGYTNGDISSQMSISQSTVKTHIKSLFDKSQLQDRLSLALRYRRCFKAS